MDEVRKAGASGGLSANGLVPDTDRWGTGGDAAWWMVDNSGVDVPMPDSPALFTLRQPSMDSAELVITERGRSKVYRLSFSQIRLLNAQSAQALAHWPVQEVPFG